MTDVLFMVAEVGSPGLDPVPGEVEQMLGWEADYGSAIHFLEKPGRPTG